MPEPAFPPPSPVPPAPPEPVELRDRTRALMRESPADGRALLAEGRWIADELWPRWSSELEGLGVDRPALVTEAGRCSRELWLWLMGDRQWDEVAGLMYGGARRRAPVSPSTPEPRPAGSG